MDLQVKNSWKSETQSLCPLSRSDLQTKTWSNQELLNPLMNHTSK